jgi:XTP/dITP diphosphohydrolase
MLPVPIKMISLQKIVLASNNAGKLKEFNELLSPYGLTVINQAALGIAQANEPYCTFVENSLTKARHASALSGLPALADDSGLCVRALNGAPGVLSARFAQALPGVSADEANNQKLMQQLHGVSQRDAHYVAVLVLVRYPQDPEPLIAQANWAGVLAAEPLGAGGFGYDPYFFLPELGMTVAQLDLATKNRLSHRGRALGQLLEQMHQAGLLPR